MILIRLSVAVCGVVPGADYNDLEYPADYWLGQVVKVCYDPEDVCATQSHTYLSSFSSLVVGRVLAEGPVLLG